MTSTGKKARKARKARKVKAWSGVMYTHEHWRYATQYNVLLTAIPCEGGWDKAVRVTITPLPSRTKKEKR